MSYVTLSYALYPFTSFIITYWLTKRISARAEVLGLVDTDLHKPDRRKVARVGGIAIMLGYMIPMAFTGLLGVSEKYILAVLFSSSLGGVIGLFDDLFKLNKVSLILLTLLIGVPIATLRAGIPIVYSSPWGKLNLGVYFWLAVPFIFAFLTNGVNIYAGFNGLEAGLGAITAGSLAVCAILYGSREAALSLLSLTGSLLGFLIWNKYPAKVFPGNVGTYFVGSVLAASIIVGTIKLAGIIAIVPYFVNFLLRLKDGFKWTVGKVDAEGKVYEDRINALWAIFMYKRPRDEWKVVRDCWLLQLLFGALAVMVAIMAKLR